MDAHSLVIRSTSPDQTARLAARLAATLTAGDVILLEGDVGAGKTHFARALIQSLLAVPEDVPSPTFTLVQTYGTDRGEVWHADLYRLTSTLEVEELGLLDAFESDICLIEWPDRLGPSVPAAALTLHLSAGTEEEARDIHATWTDPRWTDKIAGWDA